jgi:formate--tetrahydrofolate ligase
VRSASASSSACERRRWAPGFGIKGGAAGGGYAQVVPMEDLNLHFTGDLHAITAANNLLAAMIEASLLHAASEVMAIVAVAHDLFGLRERLGRITVGFTYDGEPVTAEHLKAAGAMTVLLKDAIKPNLVQTLEGQPALLHCGPFANIAHGNNSLVADRVALKLGDYVVTESGFGSDMGMERFLDIVCRLGNPSPNAVVLVTTIRALKHHGGDPDGDVEAVERGAANLRRHLGIVKAFGLNAVVAVNRFPDDGDDEVEAVRRLAVALGARAAEVNEGFERGGDGAAALAEAVADAADSSANFRPIYELDDRIDVKIEKIATRIYGADGVVFQPRAQAAIGRFTEQGYGRFTEQGYGRMPGCMAKTHLSLSHDATLLNAPGGFTVPVRDIRAYTGAGWLVALCGEMMTMPGLGATPAAAHVDIDEQGRTVGLF